MNSKTLMSDTGPVVHYSLNSLDQSPPALHVLTNQQLTSLTTVSGTGFIQFTGSHAVTRWRADPTCDALGYFFYLRDLESGSIWSLGYQPICSRPDQYEVSHTAGTVDLHHVEHEIGARLEECIHPTLNTDLRRITLTNNSNQTRTIELTSYAEIVLQDSLADRGHPAFSKLFVETQSLGGEMLLAHRRPRGSNENTLFACHYLVDELSGSPPTEWETSRNNFIGRGRSLRNPIALVGANSLSGTEGSVLDPVFSLRKILLLAPGESAQVTFALSVASSRADLLNTAESLNNVNTVGEAFVHADNAAEECLKENGLSPTDLPQLQEITARRLLGLTDVRFSKDSTNPNGFSSTECSNNSSKFTGENQRMADYLTHLGIVGALTPIPALESIQARERGAMGGANRSRPSQIALGESQELLHFDNGIGGFSTDGREYVMRLRPLGDGTLQLPPLPWNNVISNQQIGFIASETGAGYTWAGNSRLNRLTPWQNDPVCDPHSETFYLRDQETGNYWSLTPGPIAEQTTHEVRHGWGYTTYHHTCEQLEQTVCQFVPCEDSVKITQICLTNHGDKPRHLSLYGYAQWDLSDGRPFDPHHTDTTLDPARQAIYATNARRLDYAEHTAFAAVVGSLNECYQTADRSEFIGVHRSVSDPQAIATGENLSGRYGANLDPCAAIQAIITIAPGETKEYAYLLGETSNRDQAQQLIDAYQSPAKVSKALSEVKSFWVDTLTAVQIETPAPAIDLVVNGWLPYQNLSCRFWGRSSSYQSGGAYGFRDQLQDSAALIHHWPELTREQILRNAAHQFVEGDVLHWWHPPQSSGIRTNFADDLLWLPLVASEYVQTTGDQSLWEEQVRFITSELVPPGEPEIFLTPQDSGRSGTVYEHCCLALDRGLTNGVNGLPLMGTGDWNDGMNRVGQQGRGESVWMGFFIDYILERMIPVCQQHGDTQRAVRYSDYRDQLRNALNDAGWDGSWYRRAYFDDGTPLGTAAADECRIDALVQAWAVMSGAAPKERAASAIAEADKRLVDEQAGIIRLLDPPFDKMKNDPGYIKGYLPGVRENGGQYTHGVLWLIRAIAEMGQGTRACQLLEMISPASHGNSPEVVDIYKAEPYVVAADVYGQPPHVGRSGWSWYTGSAGWMFRVAVESLLGIHLEEGNQLRIDPCISADWPECRVRYRLSDRKTVYEIHIQNPNKKERGVTSAVLDGTEVEVAANGALVPVERDGLVHNVVVIL
ncbi:GH36-type glycosyl hydrolase domain-containing protein [Bythopirellula polymerisocia]|uniref:N,N'-diacetylchitobiose phosphorylase n=1 Tax=Bythopirellula polymerisocia TaxID=2528003 RepID=A0A5C6D285_9BACT|nr:glycosyl transferase [Bythopirellula polymerisocia]TWU29326.1 N,N'-diacetylchitobiose phosphorylase [Bythopirellula polymerisocia]